MSENIIPTVPMDTAPESGDSSYPKGSDLEGSAQPTDATVGRSDPKGKRFPFLLTISLIILSIIATLGIYILFQARAMTLDALAPSSTPVPSPSPPTDPTVNWQEYVNTKYAYSFKHPNNFKIRPFAGSQDEPNTASAFSLEQDNSGSYAQITANNNGLTVTSKLTQVTSINNYDTFSISHPDGYPNDPTPVLIIELRNGKQIVQFVFSGIDKLDELANQILSTFKFADCTTNKSLSLSINLPTSWTCAANIDKDEVGSLSLKSGNIDVEISDGGRGPYCGDGEDPENLCKITQLNLSDKFNLSIFNYAGEDKEIFGGLGKTNRDTNLWISVKYKDMETKPLTESQKKSLLELLNSIKTNQSF